MTPSLDTLSSDIGQTVSRIIGTDLALLRGYSEAKARSIAHFTLLMGEAYAAGEITAGQLEREQGELARMVARFVRNLGALVSTTAERLTGQIMGLLTGTIGMLAGAAGLAVPVARVFV